MQLIFEGSGTVWYARSANILGSDGGVCVQIVANVDLNVFGFLVLLGLLGGSGQLLVSPRLAVLAVGDHPDAAGSLTRCRRAESKSTVWHDISSRGIFLPRDLYDC